MGLIARAVNLQRCVSLGFLSRRRNRLNSTVNCIAPTYNDVQDIAKVMYNTLIELYSLDHLLYLAKETYDTHIEGMEENAAAANITTG
jgi:hypothetical protein